MAQIVHNVPDNGLDEGPGWEAVTAGVDRLSVPGGWIYRTDPGGERSFDSSTRARARVMGSYC